MINDKQYLTFDPTKGFPAGEEIRYECLLCGDTLLSIPLHAVACKCRNVIVDVDAGRITVKDTNSFRAYVINLDKPLSKTNQAQ